MVEEKKQSNYLILKLKLHKLNGIIVILLHVVLKLVKLKMRTIQDVLPHIKIGKTKLQPVEMPKEITQKEKMHTKRVMVNQILHIQDMLMVQFIVLRNVQEKLLIKQQQLLQIQFQLQLVAKQQHVEEKKELKELQIMVDLR